MKNKWYKHETREQRKGRLERAKNYYRNHREEQLEHSKDYYQKHKEKLNKLRRDYYWANREAIAIKQKSLQRSYQRRLKEEVLTHYGGGKYACIHCGFNDMRALSLDHIAGGGNKERRETGIQAGYTFYRKLRQQGFPEGYQTLCMNCQWIKRYENNETKRS